MPNIWIFSNKRQNYYDDTDWDTTTILKTKHYYFKENESNKSKVKKGDFVLLREYGKGFWGSCEVEEDWVHDESWKEKGHGQATGWFPIKNIITAKPIIIPPKKADCGVKFIIFILISPYMALNA